MKTFGSWKLFGQIMEWVGAIYFVGFVILAVGVIMLIPKYQQLFSSFGQAAIFGFGEQAIWPLLLLFLITSSLTWFEGRELQNSSDLNWYDKVASVSLFLVTIFISTPQLYQGFVSVFPAIKG